MLLVHVSQGDWAGEERKRNMEHHICSVILASVAGESERASARKRYPIDATGDRRHALRSARMRSTDSANGPTSKHSLGGLFGSSYRPSFRSLSVKQKALGLYCFVYPSRIT